MATGTVRVIGLRELQRDFKRISKDLDKGMTAELKKAAAPVADQGERLALTRIRNMPATPHWAGMRIGVSAARGSVYMVPSAKRRGGGSGRPNLGGLLLTRAMEPALEDKQNEVLESMEDFLDRLGRSNGF